MEKTFEFNSLSKTAQERLKWIITSASPPYSPLLAETVHPSIRASIILAILSFIVPFVVLMIGLGHLGHRMAWQGLGYIVFYAFAAFVFLFAIFHAFYVLLQKESLPFPAGRYVLALDFVDARTSKIRLVPMSDLAKIHPTHQYSGTTSIGAIVHLVFSGGLTETFAVKDPLIAQRIPHDLATQRELVNQLWQKQDWTMLGYFDPFFELRSSDWRFSASLAGEAKPSSLPAILSRGWILALLLAIPLSVPVWAARNLFSDHLLYRTSLRNNTEAAYKDYLAAGWLHKAQIESKLPEMALQEARKSGTEAALLAVVNSYPNSSVVPIIRKELPGVALQEALRLGTVTSLRSVLKNYPESGIETKALDEIHFLFEHYRNSFHTHAPSSDPDLINFVDRLLTYQEANQNNQAYVRFKSPSVNALKSMSSIATIATHFESGSVQHYENSIVQRLLSGFQCIFPADVLTLSRGEPFSNNPEDVRVPTIFIAYEIQPSNVRYEFTTLHTAPGFGPTHSAILTRFFVVMQVPGPGKDYSVKYNIEPPESLLVSYRRKSLLDEGPPREEIYAELLKRAFDEFMIRLRTAFFRKGTQAFDRSA